MNRTSTPILLQTHKHIYLCVPSSFAVKDKELSDEFLDYFAKLNSNPTNKIYTCPMIYIMLSKKLPENFDFSYMNWETACWSIMKGCDEVLVPRIPGWDKSTGVLSEINAASVLGKPLIFTNYKSVDKV